MADREIGDPWEDPHSEAQRLIEENRKLAKDLLARRVEFNRVEELWQKVIAPSRTAEDCVTLGESLHRQNCEFWIKLALLNLRQFHKARGIEKPRLSALLRIAVLRLLLASCRQDRAEIETELQKTHDAFSHGAAVEAVDDAKGFLSVWSTGEVVPATPHMTRQQLVAAVEDIPGMSGPSISRAIRKGRISIEEPIDEMVRFHHRDSKIQRTILDACADFLKSQ
jgi:hypothetical protein